MERDTHIQQDSEADNNSEMINSLNSDCWHLIFDYLSVKELLQTEATCKDWQKLVLNHVSHQQIVICESLDEENLMILRKTPKAWASFKRWVKKCGHSVQEFYMDCQHFKDVVEVLRESCPNLNVLSLCRLKKKLSPTSALHFQKLTELKFEYCDEVTDDCVSQFLNSDMEDLAIMYNKRVTGRFLNNLKSDKMRSLTIIHCRAFKLPFLLSATDHLTNLEELELCKRNRNKIEIRSQLYLLLDRLPNLRDIRFEVYDLLSHNVDSLAESNRFFESVCRLENLERVTANFQAWNHHLEAIAISCKEITGVELRCNGMTQIGLDALCRHAGHQLFQLDLSESLITEDDVIACVYACPKLMHLELCDCRMLDYPLVMRRIAAARRDMRRSVPASEHFRLQLVMCKDDDEGDIGWEFFTAINDVEDVIHVSFPMGSYSTDRLY